MSNPASLTIKDPGTVQTLRTERSLTYYIWYHKGGQLPLTIGVVHSRAVPAICMRNEKDM